MCYIRCSSPPVFRPEPLYGISIHQCDVYVGGKVRVSEFMIFLDLKHRGSK